MTKRLFTLIELLAVVAIIAILASLTLGLIGYGNRRAKEIKTTATLKKVEMVIEAYKLERGAYPDTVGATKLIWTDIFSLNDAATPPVVRWKSGQTGSPLLPGMVDVKAFSDAWKNADGTPRQFNYCCPGTHSAYDLWSVGDDDTNAADDITNWTRN
jgi:prepilin-type N-terminal cleavage/methylation domain-containing protein